MPARENGRSSSDRPSAHRGSSTTDSRISKGYRSPPLSSKVRANEHRSRRDSPSPDPDPDCLSSFYRQRFGSHSPEDYLNLRLSQFDKSLSKEDIKSILEREFRHLAPFEIKIVRNPEDDERLAYVNFEGRDCAKSVRRSLVNRLRKVLGRNIAIDPAGVIRDQDGKYIPDRFNRAAVSGMRPQMRTRSPQPRFTRSIGSIGLPPIRHHRSATQLNQDDEQAGRTLFVGNLPGDIRESELRRAFEIYGPVEDVDIKTLSDNNAAYAFILMGTVEEAIQARREQHDKPIRPAGKHCQLGYGKTQISPRIIVGGLNEWATKDIVLKAFERYGEIESIEYEVGDSHAFIHYVENQAASDAVADMKNFPLGGSGDTCVTVDFIKDPNAVEKPKIVTTRKRIARSISPTDGRNDDQVKRRPVGPRTPSLSPSTSPTRAGYINSLADLREHLACTWKGHMVLKKTEYLMSFYRLFGREHLIQEHLRDNIGLPTKLSINQRLPIVPDLYQRLIDFDRTELALILAVEAEKPIQPLIKYLKEKNAAGVITVENACLYVLPYSDTSEKLIKFFSPRVKFLNPDDETYMLIALKRAQTIQQQQQKLLTNSGLPPEAMQQATLNAATGSPLVGLAAPPSISVNAGGGGIVPAHSLF